MNPDFDPFYGLFANMFFSVLKYELKGKFLYDF